MIKLPVTFPELETDRLLLRKLSLPDAPEIYQLRSDKMQNEFIDRPLAISISDAEKFINMIDAGIERKESLLWAIQMKGEKNLAGTVLLWHFDAATNRTELGYEMLARYQGKGIMHEAINKVLDYTFSVLQISVVEAWTHPGNKKSIAVLERLGFKRDAAAELNKPDDVNENIFSLAASDYSYK